MTSLPRTVLLASPCSFCAGVERAIEIVELVMTQRGAPVCVRKQIVHNTHVVSDPETRGAVFVGELDEVPGGATVVFSAHGVSPAVRADAVRRTLSVIDATCPLVTKVHGEARRAAARGDTIVLIGHAGHEEVDGTLGEAPAQTVLAETAAEIAGLDPPTPGRVSYLTQTTLAVDETTTAIAALTDRFPDATGPGAEDICYATTNRQNAVAAIAAESDVVLVVGSANSSVRLVEVGRRGGIPAHLIDDAARYPTALAGRGGDCRCVLRRVRPSGPGRGCHRLPARPRPGRGVASGRRDHPFGLPKPVRPSHHAGTATRSDRRGSRRSRSFSAQPEPK